MRRVGMGSTFGIRGRRSDWDSNPGESFEAPYTLSRRAPSTTRTSLRIAARILAWAGVGVNDASLQMSAHCDTLMRQPTRRPAWRQSGPPPAPGERDAVHSLRGSGVG